MEEIAEEGREEIRNDRGEPEEFVVIKDNAGEKSINEEVREGEDDADDGEFTDAGGGFRFFLGGLRRGFVCRLFGCHGLIIP